jgi:hypothetical protein
MAHNIVEFWDYKENVPATAQYTALPEQPFGATIATGSVMGVEVTFVETGYDGSTIYVGAEKWLIAARYSDSNTVGSTASHWTASRIGWSGATIMLLSSCALSVAAGTPRIMWQPYKAGNRWTIRGHLWVYSAA